MRTRASSCRVGLAGAWPIPSRQAVRLTARRAVGPELPPGAPCQRTFFRKPATLFDDESLALALDHFEIESLYPCLLQRVEKSLRDYKNLVRPEKALPCADTDASTVQIGLVPAGYPDRQRRYQLVPGQLPRSTYAMFGRFRIERSCAETAVFRYLKRPGIDNQLTETWLRLRPLILCFRRSADFPLLLDDQAPLSDRPVP